MRSKPVTIRVPHVLYEALQKHAREAGYANAGQLMIWSAFYSLLIGKPHHVTAPIAQASPEVQDLFIEDVVAAYERGDLHKGSYFEHILEDIVQRFNLPVSPEVVRAMVSDAVRNRPRKKADNPKSPH